MISTQQPIQVHVSVEATLPFNFDNTCPRQESSDVISGYLRARERCKTLVLKALLRLNNQARI